MYSVLKVDAGGITIHSHTLSCAQKRLNFGLVNDVKKLVAVEVISNYQVHAGEILCTSYLEPTLESSLYK